MQRLARRLVTFANLNLCVVNVRQNLAEGAANACPKAQTILEPRNAGSEG
jgi:hypothetical protein